MLSCQECQSRQCSVHLSAVNDRVARVCKLVVLGMKLVQHCSPTFAHVEIMYRLLLISAFKVLTFCNTVCTTVDAPDRERGLVAPARTPSGERRRPVFSSGVPASALIAKIYPILCIRSPNWSVLTTQPTHSLCLGSSGVRKHARNLFSTPASYIDNRRPFLPS